ncbi:hypothetical protein BKN37_01870 [Mycobacterium talmoniae]|nr:hypothetical protein BKN37_01870 [Mycobacterium talmoniae]TDH56136.1 LuxR family transcriptional regulator [Mycobacterium eburneum]
MDCAAVSLDDFSRIVSGIYNSALAPDDWTAVLGDIRQTLDAQACGLVVAEGKTRSIKSGSLLPEAQTPYCAYYHQIDYVLEAVEQSPVGLIHRGQSLVALRARSEFDADWLRPHRMDDGLFVRLTDGAAPICFVVAGPRHPEPFVKLIAALVPHLQQALRTETRLGDLQRRCHGLDEAAHALRHGVVIVAHGPRMLYANAAAEQMLCSADGLRTRTGRLEAVLPSADTDLQHAVQAALAPGSTDRRGSSFPCPRRSGSHPYLVDVVPLTAATEPESPRRAMIVIVDPDDQPDPPAAVLRQVYGLTPGEADVALLVLDGHGLKHICDELSLSQATVKTHLQHVFDKTGTHRQAELVRVLLSLRSVCR